MTTRMLIDARHQEETRVAVLKGNRIEEFDFESAEHKQIKGNIYLAKVTRVEPSLQAAFVDFGGNRHGFLAFNEIHPDYYQIPKEDRDALLAEEAEHAEEEARLRAEEDADESEIEAEEHDLDDGDEHEAADSLAEELADGDDDHGGLEEMDTSEKDDVSTIEDGNVSGPDDDDDSDDNNGGRRNNRRRKGRRQGGNGSRARAADEARAKRLALRRRYKIQDVIQRRQVLLVQVVKEERGNKGAALTTYLSLAGRYCVLMPNSSHGGGISRKISSAADRKRLKQIVSEMSLPKSMGCIVRTAGLSRTKTEIKRDFDYLARLWDEIRENTLKSSAPALIHSDSDLIKRAIRDIYNREIEEVIVEGEQGYRSAKEFMKLLMPSHARRVKQYADPVPLFQRYGAEDQLTAMYDPVVQLKSGGYLVINPTEALVSIDINSGRSTKEHGIEQTALSTNLEAAREISRQLRLRDMAGLVVIDFIDMEHNSSIRKVEKCMKDSLKTDRARIQVGRISGFGLMEMSRQRLRTGVLEATTRECPHCDGTGLVRTASSAGLSALRLIEDEAAKGKGSVISLYASTEAAIYLLNAKRADLAEIEDRYSVSVEVIPEGENEGAKMRVGSSGPKPRNAPKFEVIQVEEDDNDPVEDDEEDEVEENRGNDNSDDDGNRRKRRRRRRGGRRNRGRNRDDENGSEGDDRSDDEGSEDGKADDQAQPEIVEAAAEAEADAAPKKRRRRSRRKTDGDAAPLSEEASEGETEAKAEEPAAEVEAKAVPAAEPEAEEKPKKRRTRRKKAEEPKPDAEEKAEEAAPEAEAAVFEAEAEEKPKKRRTRRKKVEEPAPEAEIKAEQPAVEPEPAAPEASEPAPANDTNGETGEDGEPRRGWWQRTFGN
ncbi:Rne/Rng family ribonuclease [Croceicoccus naphthovorans]|uniref:Ribonuclease E n=1 Tax=Croceicoccus naphthovorans TaxID=1348774 RepID=A0A0G3XFE5_9SPHN|nr:ribonuclease E/G [Croceicoccus naphthovorans]AKM09932.1 ribonuclease [Croceicoccus naphthovorans]MBB3990917.1 ribonuclease E [Croceicoccus naphthovorans]